MKTDPIPTFRRGARAILRGLRSPKLPRFFVRLAIAFVLIAIVGMVASLTGRGMCERRFRSELSDVFARVDWTDIEWLPRDALRRIPLPRSALDPISPHERPDSIFAPSVTYIDEEPPPPVEENDPETFSVFVRAEAPLPFIVRVHFRYLRTFPGRRESPGGSASVTRELWGGVGVVTYVGGFGAWYELDWWELHLGR